jgi:hypothetical protein
VLLYGEDDADQLIEIMKVLGTPSMSDFSGLTRTVMDSLQYVKWFLFNPEGSLLGFCPSYRLFH